MDFAQYFFRKINTSKNNAPFPKNVDVSANWHILRVNIFCTHAEYESFSALLSIFPLVINQNRFKVFISKKYSILATFPALPNYSS